MRTVRLIAALWMGVWLMGCASKETKVTPVATGEDVYHQVCARCHDWGIGSWITDAPVRGDKEAWQPLMTKGIDVMTAITFGGLGKMPAKGGCETCSMEQLNAAVTFLVNDP